MGRPNDDSEGTKKVSPSDRDNARRRLEEVIGEDQTIAGPSSGRATDFAAGPTHTPTVPGGMPEKDLEAGHQVGEYVIEDVIGRGGFGTVYRAVQPLIGKRVAIKVLSRKYSADSDIVSRFIAEARAVNQIRHRHIIDIFSFGQLQDGRHYYVMEHLEGEPLDNYLRTRGALPLDEALPILRAIARALDAAHAKGIAHRDLKPENIYIAQDADGEVFPKLLDFGIAKLLGPDDQMSHKTGTGVPIGTPYYMSPEQCRGRDVDHRTDIYSFGILTYRLLTGTYPFDGELIEILHKQIHDRAPAASTRNAALSHEADQAIAWMMQKDPEQRPRTVIAAVVALQDDKTPTPMLGRSAARKAVGALPSGKLPVVPSRRRLWPYIVGALVLAGGAFAVVALTVDRGKESKPVPAIVSPASPPTTPQPATPTLDATQATTTPPAAPDAAERSHVIVTIEGVPEGTEVTGPGVTGVAPGPVQIKRGSEAVVLVFTADGHVKASRTVTPDKDQALQLTLKRKPTRPTGPRETDPDVITDPFRKPNK